LGFATFLLCILQIGPFPVWVPVAIWFYVQGHTAWAIFITVWSFLFVVSIDNFGRPFFISRGAGVPLLLIFTGVLGGLLAWGFIGIFVGATTLAVGYRLLLAWLGRSEPAG